MAVLSSLLLGGLYLDFWAHAHGRTDNTFFTPWHALLYSAMAVVGIFLGANALRSRQRGATWSQTLPPGYGLSLIGVGLFGVGGVADLIWHVIFGIEFSVDALLSPTHLVLALAGVLIVAGPLRAAWRNRGRASQPWLTKVPAALSLALLLSLLTGLTQFVHPLTDTWAARAPVADQIQAELFSMQGDGTDQTRLTISRGQSDGSPAWSPDGRTIGFARLDMVSGRDPVGELYRVNADGSGITALTRSPAWYGGPLWSPDGQVIAFSLRRSDTKKWTVAVIPGTGGGTRLLTNSGANDILDGWSPDGTRLVFHSDRTGQQQVFVMNADGSGQTQLTSAGDNWGGSWSPHDTIAFASARSGPLQIYTMNRDGSGQRRLMTSTGDDWLPEWSPDGGKLAFNSTRDGQTQIYVANADGSNPTNVLRTTSIQLSGWTPRWSPDGRSIAYTAAGNPPFNAIPFVRQSLGAAGIIVQAALLMGILLLGLRGNTLPVGSLTLIMTLNAALMSVVQDQYRLIPAAILAGLLGDLTLWRVRPSLERPASVRLFAFAVPVIFYSWYMLTLLLTGGIGWSIHLWLGTIVVAGIVGVLLSYLVLPPPALAGSGPRARG
jgi:Tol biopolymer transport system component